MKATVTWRWLTLLLALTLLLGLTSPAALAADAGETDPPAGGPNTTFSVPDTLQLDPGSGDSVSANVENDSSSTRLEWKSDNTDVLTIDYDAATLADTAYFRPLSPGVANVTVTALDSRYSRTIKVTVNGIALLKGDTVTVPENGTTTWTRGTDFERYGTAAADGVTIALTCNKNNASCRTRQEGTKEQWVFSGIHEGNAVITAQARTSTGSNAGSPVQIRVTVEENTAETITPDGSYSITNPFRLASVESAIAVQCRDMIQDTGNSLSYVTGLTADTAEGILYLGYKDADDTGSGVGTSLNYYVSTSSRGPYLRDVYFVPNVSFKGDKATITFTGVSEGGRTFKGKISISLAETTSTLALSTPEGTPLRFSSSVFANAFQKVAGAPLHSMSFALPSELQGTIYRDYVNGSNYGSKISGTDLFTQSELSELTFVPAAGYVGPVGISYAGYTAAGLRFNGELTITVTQSVDGTVMYNDGGAGQVTFSETDFSEYCLRVTGAQMGWVSFTLPSASQGTLYYNYGSSNSSPILVGDTFPYKGTPNVSYVTMAAAEGFAGTAKVAFNGATETGTAFTGTVEVHFQSAGGGMDITYTCLPGSSVKLSSNDFNNLSQSLTGQRLHYIAFQTLPDHTQGALYHNRTTANVIGSRVGRGTKYFNSAAPYLMNLSFWATDSFHGDVEIPFTGCSVSGQTFNGSLIITSGSSKTYNATISYSTAGRSHVGFVASQFDDVCRAATNSALNYLRFTSLPTSAQGNVYFDYQRAETPTTISTTDTFYLSGEVSVSKLGFLPAPGFTGTVSLPFTGWSIAGGQFQGVVQVNVSGGVTGTGILYTTTGSPVRFSAYDFYNQGGGQPVSLRFESMPYASAGKLYYQYTNPTHYSWLATPGMQYGFASDPLLSNLTFIPKAGYKGTATIPYTAMNANGGTYTGEIQIVVEPSSVSKYFSDLSGCSAEAVSAVDFLYSQGVVNGVSADRFAPNLNIRRGDFCLMLYRAFQFSSDGTTATFRDVPVDSYYAQAISVMRSQGVVEGTGSNSFRPNASISRQDAALMVQRTLRAAGLNAADGTDADLERFADSSGLDGYARGAVTCLLKQGIMPVSGSNLSPKAALTRSDMAVLLHRAVAQ